MKKIKLFKFTIAFTLVLSACGIPTSASIPDNTPTPVATPTQVPNTSIPLTVGPTAIVVNADTPCVGAPAPAQWQHVVVIMFENQKYDQVIGVAPYVTKLAHKCGSFKNWKDADYKVDGSPDGISDYDSKPNYATLTNGLSPTAHGLLDDTYDTQTEADNIYNQLNLAGKSFKDYYEGDAGGCAVDFDGDYHDAIRYYTDVADICNAHDVPLSTFLKDLKSGVLPAFSLILPENKNNMHDDDIGRGDAFALTILNPLLNSPLYAKGDVAIFFLWDEDTPIPNVLLAPSIVSGSQSEDPVSHFSALRTWEEMLHLPLLGDTGKAPSLLPFFGAP